MKKSDAMFFELSKLEVIIIFIYYTIILIVGGAVSIEVLCQIIDNTFSKQELMLNTVCSSLSVSGMLCSLQYIKRLYKACITDRIVPKTTPMGRVGNVVYFLFRPIYAFTFVIVMIFALLSGMFMVIGSLDYIINDKFLYLCVLLSSCIGYSVGHLLDKFEKISNAKIDEIK